jgi:hypothetical protein
MRSFNAGSFGQSDDPWFRVGDVGVTTTLALIGTGVASLFIYVVEGGARGFSKYFWMVTQSTGLGSPLDGQIWRIFTWPLVLEPGARVFWTLILFAIFFMLGSQVEAKMGRIPYTAFLAAITVVPAVLMIVVEVLTGIDGGVGGLRYLEFAVLIAFALAWPAARFWPGLPAWVIAAGIVVIEALQTVADRNWYGLLFGALVVALALILTRSMGHAEDADWIPRAPLPAVFAPSYGYGRPSRPSRPSRSRRRSNLRPVAPPDPVESDLADMEIDALLDQVATEGLDSLTKEQRKKLEDHSKRLRKRKDS